jgi:putative iron-dependent peroxidase
VPSATFLEAVQDDEPAAATTPVAMSVAAPAADEPSLSPAPPRDGSLGIGSLKGDIRHE